MPRVGLLEFKKNLREFHRIAEVHRGRCVFIINHTIAEVAGKQGNGKSYNENFEIYNAAIRAQASQSGVAAIDLPMIMKLRQVDLRAFLADDHLHLSARGNLVYADMVFSALKVILDS